MWPGLGEIRVGRDVFVGKCIFFSSRRRHTRYWRDWSSDVCSPIYYKPEYQLDDNGKRVRDKEGNYIRLWRPEIKSEDDIWEAIVSVSNLPGLTGSPKLQPIASRQVMLSTGMKAPMGLKVYGPDLAAIEQAGLQMEKALKEVEHINHSSVYYDRAEGAPYIEIALDREKLGRYGIQVGTVQSVIETAIGGMAEGNTVEGRERFPIRVRYARELRDDPEVLQAILVPASDGTQIPLGQLATFNFVKGAIMIQSENTFLVGYITFDKQGNEAEVEVVNRAKKHIDELVAQGKIKLAKGDRKSTRLNSSHANISYAVFCLKKKN